MVGAESVWTSHSEREELLEVCATAGEGGQNMLVKMRLNA